MNKILWIMTKTANACANLQNKYASDLLKNQKILGYGSVDAGNYDEFFNDENSFWMLLQENDDCLPILEEISSSFELSIIARCGEDYYCFDYNGRRFDNNWTQDDAEKLIKNNWNINSNSVSEQDLNPVLLDENLTNEKISIEEELERINNTNIEDGMCLKCSKTHCDCEEEESEYLDIHKFLKQEDGFSSCASIDEELANLNKDFDKATTDNELCENCFCANCTCDKSKISNNVDDINPNNEPFCNEGSCENCSGCDWTKDEDLDELYEFTSDTNQSHHFNCVCSDDKNCSKEAIEDCGCEPCECNPCECGKNKIANLGVETNTIQSEFFVHENEFLTIPNKDIEFFPSNDEVINEEENKKIDFDDVELKSFQSSVSYNDEFVSTSNNYENDKNEFISDETINTDEENEYKLDDADVSEFKINSVNEINELVLNNYVNLNNPIDVKNVNEELYSFQKEDNLCEFVVDSFYNPQTNNSITTESNDMFIDHETQFNNIEQQATEFPSVELEIIGNNNVDNTIIEIQNENPAYEQHVGNEEDFVDFDESINENDSDFIEQFKTNDYDVEENAVEYEIENEEVYEDNIIDENPQSRDYFYEIVNSGIENQNVDNQYKEMSEINGYLLSRDLKEFLLELQREKERLRKKRDEIQKRNKRARQLILDHLNNSSSNY